MGGRQSTFGEPSLRLCGTWLPTTHANPTHLHTGQGLQRPPRPPPRPSAHGRAAPGPRRVLCGGQRGREGAVTEVPVPGLIKSDRTTFNYELHCVLIAST